jgi:hypothetical protein
LPGVNLTVPFAVSATDPQHQISSVKYTIGGQGGRSGTASPTGSPGAWSFTDNVGILTTGDHPLIVTAYDSTGKQLASFTGVVQVVDLPLSFDLKAAFPGGSPQEVQDLRFIRSIPLSETFTGTIKGLPDYYQHSSLQIKLGNGLVTGVTPESIGGNLGFVFTKDAGGLPNGTTNISVLVGSVDLSRFGAEPEPVLAINKPSWLAASTPSFNVQDGSYHFDHAHPEAKLTIPTPPVHTGIDWLDAKLKNLKTFARLKADLDVVAPLVLNEPAPTFKVNSLQAEAKVLGQSVWNQTYGSSSIVIGGKLDPQNLTPTGLSIALAKPELLGTQTFLDKTFSIQFTQAQPLLGVEASLHVLLTGSLTANAGIEFTWQQDHLALDPAGTFFHLKAVANATISVSAKAQILNGWLGTYEATAFLKVKLTLDGTAHFGGSLAHPSLASTDLHAVLSGSFGYHVLGTQKITKDPIDQGDSEVIDPITLF